MPQRPSGGGSMVPPMRLVPWPMMWVKESRSIASTMALRILASSNGGLSRLTSRLAWVLVGNISQIAHGAWVLRSFSTGSAISAAEGRGEHPRARDPAHDLGLAARGAYHAP